MEIKIRYSEDKKKILANIKEKDSELADLIIGMMFGKEEQIVEMLGDVPPDVYIDGDRDEKLEKEVKDFEKFLDKFYESYYKKRNK